MFAINRKVNKCFVYLLTITTIGSVVIGEECAYVRGPLAATNDTLVIHFNCNQSTPLSHYVPLPLRYKVSHVAVQLMNCSRVPLGLFANVSDDLKSVTVASKDAVQLDEGTFEGLQYITELRLLGFTMLKKLSRSLLEPLRNIRTLIFNGFGSSNIRLSHLGSVIQKLSGTPIRRLVLNKIKKQAFYQHIMTVDNFSISNVSLKELIISDSPVNYKGSIRRAFPELICFHGGFYLDEQTVETLPAIWDLIFLSDHLKELILYRPEDLPVVRAPNAVNVLSVNKFFPSILNVATLYPELVKYFLNRPAALDCELGVQIKFGANLSKVIMFGLSFLMKAEKPICIHENNNITYVDFTEAHLPSILPVYIGFQKLNYLSLESTDIRKLPAVFLQYYPSLEVLKLSRNDIGNFIKTIDENFFGSCPSLADIRLHNCNITKVSSTIFSRSVNLQHLDMSNNYLPTFDFDLQNCTNLTMLNFSRNNIESISDESIAQLTQLALQKTGGNDLAVDLSYNRLHCLCNSTAFIKWVQRLPANSKTKFPGFDEYNCLYPNGSIVRLSRVITSELDQQCSAIRTLVNNADCPCDKERRQKLQQIWVYLDGYYCRNDAGDLVPMKNRPLPSCFNPYTRASFIAPVVIGSIFGIAVLITVGLLIYYRNSRKVKQVRECLEMNPIRFVQTAVQYAMMRNHAEVEENTAFRFDIFIFAQDDDRSSVHNQFIALQGKRSFITRDNFFPGVAEVDCMAESIGCCRWILPVLTSNFLSDQVCVDFISRAQFRRPHALIPIIREEARVGTTDVSVSELLRTAEPLYWPGDLAAPEDKEIFWSSLLERTASP